MHEEHPRNRTNSGRDRRMGVGLVESSYTELVQNSTFWMKYVN
jgi:hypothetical protein